MVTKAANSNDAAILVSVIVPTYRRKESLYRALLSLTHQTYPNIAIILSGAPNNPYNQFQQYGLSPNAKYGHTSRIRIIYHLFG